MTELPPAVIGRIQSRIRHLFHRASRKTSCGLPPLREFSQAEHLPWEARVPKLTAEELHLLRGLRQELNHELAAEAAISDAEVLHFALEELQAKFRSSRRQDILSRLASHLWNTRRNKSIE